MTIDTAQKPTRVRYLVLLMMFFIFFGSGVPLTTLEDCSGLRVHRFPGEALDGGRAECAAGTGLVLLLRPLDGREPVPAGAVVAFELVSSQDICYAHY